jgi:signal transduction histidine kinase
MASAVVPGVPLRWELAAEAIAVKIRWFGLALGYGLVVFSPPDVDRAILAAILGVGAVYTLLDTIFSWRGQVFLGRSPLTISVMEALFIGLLCYFHVGLESPFAYYYFLSLICCAIRHATRVTLVTCALHCASFGLLFFAQPPERQAWSILLRMIVMLVWVTWASSAMALLLKRVGDHLGRLNAALQENQTWLEARIAERTRALQESQAHVLHQEKMATFGLLAAGIAHEVGNPLTAISSLVQMLQRRDCDGYARDKLALVSGQLQRIQVTLRELTQCGRPASGERDRVSLKDVIDEALNLAKYYKRFKGRAVVVQVPENMPIVRAARDQLVQVVLNLVLNAIDATNQGGHIDLVVMADHEQIHLRVIDDGHGISDEQTGRLFQPYFTTKKHGTGLGLFVSRQLIADHGGSVTCSSRIGEGTCFEVRLPIERSSI